MKRTFIAVIVLLMVLALCACSASSQSPEETSSAPVTGSAAEGEFPADGPEYTLIVAMVASDGSVMDEATEYYGQLLEERSNGKIKFDIYTDAQLGNLSEIQAGVKAGDIDIAVTSLDSTYSNKLAIFDMPMIYKLDDATLKTLREGAFRDLVDEACEEAGIKLLSIAPLEYRLSGGQSTIETMDDFKDWKIRTMENQLHMKLWTCLGASPTPLAMGEVYVALQQHLVNAYENLSDAFVLTKMYEQLDYFIETEHITFINHIWMNLDTFNSMPEAYQHLMLSCEEEVVNYQVAEQAERTEANYKTLEDAGLIHVTLSDELKGQMWEAVQPMVDDVRAQAGDELVDTLLEELEKNGG